ncbi:hypothetical protein LJC59_08950, partial [Desulfovibrio sp. OttesenSCG-928-A18]|nr:hypothetical protein [Desulfovibrio sp. OttesenSCG-928-A18]
MPVSYTHDVPFFSLSSLLAHKRVALQCPDSPTPDSLAAAFGLFLFFKANGCTPHWFYCGPEPLSRPNALEMQRAFALTIRHEPDLQYWRGLLITVGCQYGAASLGKVTADAVAVVDCHVPEGDQAVLGEIRPYLTSCSTIVHELLLQAEFPIDHTLGTALRFGLYAASNAFSEIRFPVDKDMRDTVDHDPRLFLNLARSNLCPEDLSLTAKALCSLDFQTGDGMVISNLLPCDPELLRFIADLALHVHGVDLSLVFMETDQGTRFSIRSVHREIHAGKAAAGLVADGLGAGGGDVEKGGGFISAAKYDAAFAPRPLTDFFRDALRAYRDAYDLFDCRSDAPLSPGVLHAYQKRPVLLAYVVCSRLFPKQTRLEVRMLEGDIVITVTPDTYLMIGLAGEVYPIRKK